MFVFSNRMAFTASEIWRQATAIGVLTVRDASGLNVLIIPRLGGFVKGAESILPAVSGQLFVYYGSSAKTHQNDSFRPGKNRHYCVLQSPQKSAILSKQGKQENESMYRKR